MCPAPTGRVAGLLQYCNGGDLADYLHGEWHPLAGGLHAQAHPDPTCEVGSMNQLSWAQWWQPVLLSLWHLLGKMEGGPAGQTWSRSAPLERGPVCSAGMWCPLSGLRACRVPGVPGWLLCGCWLTTEGVRPFCIHPHQFVQPLEP